MIGSKADLECAVVDAARLGQLAYLAICHLGFESKEPPKLSADEVDLVYWTIIELSQATKAAEAAFYAACEARGR